MTEQDASNTPDETTRQKEEAGPVVAYMVGSAAAAPLTALIGLVILLFILPFERAGLVVEGRDEVGLLAAALLTFVPLMLVGPLITIPALALPSFAAVQLIRRAGSPRPLSEIVVGLLAGLAASWPMEMWHSPPAALAFALSGSLCGYIYWLIAGSPRPPY